MTKIPLSPDHLNKACGGEFYAKKEDEKHFYIGYKNENGDIHERRISKEFYSDFIQEQARQLHRYGKV